MQEITKESVQALLDAADNRLPGSYDEFIQASFDVGRAYVKQCEVIEGLQDIMRKYPSYIRAFINDMQKGVDDLRSSQHQLKAYGEDVISRAKDDLLCVEEALKATGVEG